MTDHHNQTFPGNTDPTLGITEKSKDSNHVEQKQDPAQSDIKCFSYPLLRIGIFTVIALEIAKIVIGFHRFLRKNTEKVNKMYLKEQGKARPKEGISKHKMESENRQVFLEAKTLFSWLVFVPT